MTSEETGKFHSVFPGLSYDLSDHCVGNKHNTWFCRPLCMRVCMRERREDRCYRDVCVWCLYKKDRKNHLCVCGLYAMDSSAGLVFYNTIQ